MDKQDKEIKKALESMQSPLPDPGFTDRIVAMHLAKAAQKPSASQIDFGSLLTGMLAVLASILISYANTALKTGLTEDQVSVIQLLPVLYLIFQVLNEYFIYKDQSGLKINMAASSLLIGIAFVGMTAF